LSRASGKPAPAFLFENFPETSLFIGRLVQFRTDYRRILQGEKEAPEISRQIARLKNKKMLQPEKKDPKNMSSVLTTIICCGIIKSLDEKGFLPIKD
jgi:hypothetical protein